MLCQNGDGRKAFRRGLCQACYREAPRLQAPAGEGGQLGAVRVRPLLIQAMELAARAAGVDLASWRRAAYESALQEAALGSSRLRDLLNQARPRAGRTT